MLHRNFFPWFLFFWGFLNQLSSKTQHIHLYCRGSLCHSPPYTISHCRRTYMYMYCARDESTSMLEMNVLKTHVQASATHTATGVATNNFQTDLTMRWLLLSCTHLRKGAVSRSCVLLRVRYMYIHNLYICNSVLCWTKRSWTTALSLGHDPGAVYFAELEMMRYLFIMLKEKKLKMFPVVKKKQNESDGSWPNLDILLLHNARCRRHDRVLQLFNVVSCS